MPDGEDSEVPGRITPQNPTGGEPNNWVKHPPVVPDPGGQPAQPVSPYAPRPITVPLPPGSEN